MESSGPDKPRSEQRRYPRVKAKIQVQIQAPTNEAPSRAETSDISLCGCYLESMFTLEVGTKVSLTLWLTDQQTIRSSAVVATRHLQVGNGFEFIDMPPEERIKLNDYISACEDGFSASTQ